MFTKNKERTILHRVVRSMKWLPDPVTERTPKVLTIHVPIYFIFNKDKHLDILEGKAPYGISTDKRITRRLLKEHRPVICKPNPLTIALKYDKIYQSLPAKSMENVAQQFDITRVRVHQLLNLLTLDKRIIKHLKQLTDPKEINYWTERKLRELTRLPEENQYSEFKKISSEFREC